MDFLSPVLGTVTGIEPAQFKEILLFAGKALLFCLPFIALGLLVEADVVRVPVLKRLLKLLVVLLFTAPVILFGALNLVAGRLPEDHWAWEKYEWLEPLWIMEGTWPPVILMAVAGVYLVIYGVEILGGDLSR